MASALHPAIAYCLLKLVQLLLCLVRLAIPQLSSALTKIMLYLEGKPERECYRNACNSSSDKAILKFLQQSKGKYRDMMSMKKMGCRKGRHWYKVTGQDGREKLLTLTPVSEYCPLHLGDEQVLLALNTLLHKIQVPVLYCVEEVYYCSEDHSLILIQPFMRSGSLKDLVHKTSPNQHWREKGMQSQSTFKEAHENGRSLEDLALHQKTMSLDGKVISSSHSSPVKRELPKLDSITTSSSSSSLKQLITFSQKSPTKCRNFGGGLPVDKVASYGRQILQAMLYFYDLGFPYLGQIHSGNIFVDKDLCKLGGYENTLLGYRTRFHKLCSKENIDVIMFGHLIFEMGCGHELPTLVPSMEDMLSVTDPSLADVLSLIFHKDKQGKFTSTIEKICLHPFFQCVRILPQNSKRISRNSSLTTELSVLLSQLTQAAPLKHSQQLNRHQHKYCTIQ